MLDTLSEDETLLSEMALDTVSSLATDLGNSRQGWQDSWSTLSALGWPGVLAPADLGGIGGSKMDLLILARSLGQQAFATPFISDAATTTPILIALQDRIGIGSVKSHIAGKARIVMAHSESPLDPEGKMLIASVNAEGGRARLNGTKRMILYGQNAESLLVTARSGDNTTSLCVVPLKSAADGLSITSYRLIDGTEACDCTFTDYSIDPSLLITDFDRTIPTVLESAFACALLAASGEALGCVEMALELTVQHVKGRQQFDAPLSSLQVVRHRIANMYIGIEEMRSLCSEAARADEQAEQLASARRAKVFLGQTCVEIAECAVQLHGAMGVTQECAIGRYLKRLIVLDRMLGTADHHISALGSDLINMSGPV